MRVGHVDRRPLVPNVDDLHPHPRRLVPDRLDVAALQSEEPAHTALLKEPRDKGGNGRGTVCGP